MAAGFCWRIVRSPQIEEHCDERSRSAGAGFRRMDRARAARLCRGGRRLEDVMPAADDLGRRRRWRLCRARERAGLRADREGHRRRREVFARSRAPPLAITFSRVRLTRAARGRNLHASASIFRCAPINEKGKAPAMIDLYYWSTPNGHKITMFLEETGLEYKFFPVQIGKGEQFKPEFLAVAPNNRIPAMVDHAPKGGSKPISIFESGAMLLYLAEKTA